MREIIDFDRDWFFHKGDIKSGYPSNKGYSYITAKTERVHMGPACKDYYLCVDSYENDVEQKSERWRAVELPHDFVIEGLPDEKNNSALGFLEYDNAWYLKNFTLSEEDKNKRITLLFDGVATHATVYLNGCLMKRNFCGYSAFEVDITDVVKFGENNRLAVYVNTEEHEGWWYEGGGIYRHVRMIKTDLVSVDLYGVYVKPEYMGNGIWNVKTEVTVRNDFLKDKNVKVIGEAFSADGKSAGGGSASGKISFREKRAFTFDFEVSAPRLWSPDDPFQYKMCVKVAINNKIVDENSVKFGFRYFKLDADKGLFINGKHYKIKGLCGHADCGLMGKAVPDNIHRYKVRLMKEMGANGYRTSHYPQAEALMDALDENGFIVMDETRWFESTDEGKDELEMLMKRDRNRPSVFFWSVGNEEPHHKTEEGRRICQSLMALAHKLDDSRVIMTAVCHSPDQATVYDELEAIGINYNWSKYESVRKKYPDKAIFSSECCATGTTRGWYFDDDPNKAFITAYDHDINDGFKSREFTWKYLASKDWLLGGYQWIAFEHRGEANWPRLCSQSGAIDLFLQKKDAFYQNQSHWTEKPMIHILPHWNFAGLEGEKIKVWTYTNAEEAELFFNGESLGRKAIEKHGHGEWIVPYFPGKLEAVAYKDGKVVARDRVETSGEPFALKLTLDTTDVIANGKDIAVFTCFVTDKEGREVPDASPTVSFNSNSLGRVYSTGSDITDHGSLFEPTRKMRAGKISVAVKLGEVHGELKLYASCENLQSAVISVNI